MCYRLPSFAIVCHHVDQNGPNIVQHGISIRVVVLLYVWIPLNVAPVSAPPTDEMENAVEQETLEELIADVLATVLLKFWWPTVAADVRR